MASKIAVWLVYASRWLRGRLEHVERRLQVPDQVLGGGGAAPQAGDSFSGGTGWLTLGGMYNASAKINLDCPVQCAMAHNPVKIDEGCAAIGHNLHSMKNDGQAAMSPWFHPNGRFYNPYE